MAVRKARGNLLDGVLRLGLRLNLVCGWATAPLETREGGNGGQENGPGTRDVHAALRVAKALFVFFQ